MQWKPQFWLSIARRKETVEKVKVRKIIGSKTEKKKKYYLVHWKGELKKDATWELESNLLEDGLEEYIKEFKKKT